MLDTIKLHVEVDIHFSINYVHINYRLMLQTQLYGNVGFFVQDTISGGNWWVVLQKEPQAKHVVVEIEKLLLGMDNGGVEGILGVDMGHEHNIG